MSIDKDITSPESKTNVKAFLYFKSSIIRIAMEKNDMATIESTLFEIRFLLDRNPSFALLEFDIHKFRNDLEDTLMEMETED